MLEGALRARVRFFIEPPQYISNRKKNHQGLLDETIPVGKKPDIDNYEKSLYDSISDANCVWWDDNQVVEHTTRKVYSPNPRIEIKIKKI